MAEILALFAERLATPIGELVVVTDAGQALRAVDWTDYRPRMLELLRLHYGTRYSLADAVEPTPARTALADYFAGAIAAIDTLPVATGGTAFQRAVWDALRGIPAGETLAYGALARRLGKEAAVRAVGRANGANPVGIVVPCHRVIGADGALTGYGGGIERKRWLLDHEKTRRG